MSAGDKSTSTQRAKDSDSAPAGSRLYYLDWLRVLIIGLVFVGHTMMPFSGAPWLITADSLFPLGGLLAAIGNQFAMPVMFLISGAGTFFSLRKRSPDRFARERLLRLGLPYVVFTLLLSPVQAYYAALDDGSYSGPFFPDFLPHFFNLNGFVRLDLSWLGYYGYHLWFLGFLLFFSLAGLPLIRYLKAPDGQRLADWLARLAERRGGLLILFLPVVFLQLVLNLIWPWYQSWADTVFWGSFYLLGYLFYSDPRFIAAMRRDQKVWMWASIVTALILVVLAVLGLVGLSNLYDAVQDNPEAIKQALADPGVAIRKAQLIAALVLGYVSVLTVFNYNAWALCLLVMALGIARLNFNNRALSVAGPASMPFYVFHHPWIVVLGYYIVRLGIGAIPEMLLLGVTAFVATIAVVAFFMAPWNPLRAVFGPTRAAKRSGTPAHEPTGLA